MVFRKAIKLKKSDCFWYAQLNEDNIIPNNIEATIIYKNDYLQFLDRAKTINKHI